MKKYLIGLLVFIMCFTLVGCGSKYENNEPVEEAEQVDEDVYSNYDEEYDYGDYDGAGESDDEYGYEPYYD